MARKKPASPSPPRLPGWPTLLTPVVAEAFGELRIGVSVALWTDDGPYAQWYAIRSVPDVTSFEYEHGVESKRWSYNARSFERVRSERRIVRGEHAGFCDLFVPLGDEPEVRAVLVAGPFAVVRPTSAKLRHLWHSLTESSARMSDPSFAHYLAMTLGTTTLAGPLRPGFERLMSCFARLLDGRGAPDALASEAITLRLRLRQAVFAERMWSEAREMLDPRTAGIWSTQSRSQTLEYLGMKRAPQHVVVGLVLGRGDDIDPIDDALRRDALQRACVELARRAGDVVASRVGDHGVAFLVGQTGAASRVRARLLDVAARAQTCARRFGLALHAGIGEARDDEPLPVAYRTALGAAEKALSRRRPSELGEARPEPSMKYWMGLRRTLADSVRERPNLLLPRFDRYAEAVLIHCGYRLEPARAHLEAGLERLVEPLLDTGALDPKSFDELCASVDRSAEDAQTAAALVAPYRRLVSDIEAAMQSPTAAVQDRGVGRAVTFIREHLGETLDLAQVARVAGFAPGYFSKLFKRQVGDTFEHHTRELRLTRARQMLAATTLSIDRIARLAGFVGRSHFHRVFRKHAGQTPADYRKKAGLKASQLERPPY
jgi:AraC-like DNA-binding protein